MCTLADAFAIAETDARRSWRRDGGAGQERGDAQGAAGLRALSTRVDLRSRDLEQFNVDLTTQQLMLRNLEKNQLQQKYALAVADKNQYLRELHINLKLPYIDDLERLNAEIQRQVGDVTLLDYQKDAVRSSENK